MILGSSGSLPSSTGASLGARWYESAIRSGANATCRAWSSEGVARAKPDSEEHEPLWLRDQELIEDEERDEDDSDQPLRAPSRRAREGEHDDGGGERARGNTGLCRIEERHVVDRLQRRPPRRLGLDLT